MNCRLELRAAFVRTVPEFFKVGVAWLGDERTGDVVKGPFIWNEVDDRVDKTREGHAIQFDTGPEFLTGKVALVCAGLMPPDVFADWLQDNEAELLPLAHDWPGDDKRAQWDGVLAALRRVCQPEDIG